MDKFSENFKEPIWAIQSSQRTCESSTGRFSGSPRTEIDHERSIQVLRELKSTMNGQSRFSENLEQLPALVRGSPRTEIDHERSIQVLEEPAERADDHLRVSKTSDRAVVVDSGSPRSPRLTVVPRPGATGPLVRYRAPPSISCARIRACFCTGGAPAVASARTRGRALAGQPQPGSTPESAIDAPACDPRSLIQVALPRR